jgi:hypothetical protein
MLAQYTKAEEHYPSARILPSLMLVGCVPIYSFLIS